MSKPFVVCIYKADKETLVISVMNKRRKKHITIASSQPVDKLTGHALLWLLANEHEVELGLYEHPDNLEVWSKRDPVAGLIPLKIVAGSDHDYARATVEYADNLLKQLIERTRSK